LGEKEMLKVEVDFGGIKRGLGVARNWGFEV
jgi:hypothetical protein